MAHLPGSPFSRLEAAAFNAGVRSVIEHAYAAADAIGALSDYRHGREGYARAALAALAEAEEELILSETSRRRQFSTEWPNRADGEFAAPAAPQ